MDKNKLLVIIISIITIPLCLLATVLYKENKEIVHQHLEYPKEKKYSTNEFYTHLPIVTIDTNNQEIPDSDIKEKIVISNVEIKFNNTSKNTLSDESILKEKAKIKYRGSSSSYFDKKNLKINFIKENEHEKKCEVLGMEKSDEWVLHGPYIDKTLIRNYMWYNIASEIMESAPQSRLCELFVNNEYQGVYLMVEAPNRGEHSRIKIDKHKKNTYVTSYILRLDRGSLEEIENLNNFLKYSKIQNTILNIEYPGSKSLNQDIKDYIEKDFSRFEKSLYSYDYDSKKYGYEKYIDVESFVDYFILNEVTQNYDAGKFSTYIYKNVNGKYKMYIWDFNSACNNYRKDFLIRQDFNFQYVSWFFKLVKDEDFTEKVIYRYKQLRETYLSDEYLINYIDNSVEYLGSAVDRNFEKWGYSFDEKEGFLEPKSRNPHNYKEAIDQYKGAILQRTKWLDENIETLRQFSHESKVKKYNH